MIITDVEIIFKNNRDSSDQNVKKVTAAAECFIKKNCENELGTIISSFTEDDPILKENVEFLIIDGKQDKDSKDNKHLCENNTNYFVYTLDNFGPQSEICEDDDNGEIRIATVCELPTRKYFGLWESLLYDSNIKENLLKYARTTMIFGDKEVDPNIISCNKVILLHGPPGTGKTSLCKALAQKLSIRLQHRFERGILVEINSHSLFSKWFSESGKLVSKMFLQVKSLVENQQYLVCLLIDEVESLAHAREKCMSGNEPSDSIRVVNALLTELDKIRNHPNVLIFTTSNVTGAIDLAFVDRADIKQYIGLPGLSAIYQIYKTCVQELMKAKIISPKVVLLQNTNLVEYDENSSKLLKISEASVGFSGRTLRKLPLIAHALYLQTECATLGNFLNALFLAVEYLKINNKCFELKMF